MDWETIVFLLYPRVYAMSGVFFGKLKNEIHSSLLYYKQNHLEHFCKIPSDAYQREKYFIILLLSEYYKRRHCLYFIPFF